MTDLMGDAQLVAARRNEDRKKFLISILDDEHAPRMASGVRAMRSALLESGGWLHWTTVLAVGLRHTDVAVKTLDGILRQAVQAGFAVRRGEYSREYDRRNRRWVATDTRELQLIDWPDRDDA